jgi:hypothetical protein
VLASKNSEKNAQQRIKQTQSINLKVMKSRANQSDIRIKENMEKVKKWPKGQNKI